MPTPEQSFTGAEDEQCQPPVLTLRRPADLVAMIPYVVGFTPLDSLVVAALYGERRRFGPCLRVDLAHDDADAEPQARYLADVIASHRFSRVVLVAYSASRRRAGAVVSPLLGRLAARGTTVTEALRADGRRWWSYLCHDVACCDPGGTAYDADSSVVAAKAVLAGMLRAPDREWLRHQFEPAGVDVVSAVSGECRRLGEPGAGTERAPGAADVREQVGRWLCEPAAMPTAAIAALLLAVQEDGPRDDAWRLITRAAAARHFQLWRHLMCASPSDLMAPAGTLAAFAAWLDGRGVDASHALDRVEATRPGYPMCVLVRRLLEAMVDPAVWSGVELVADPAR
jgi:Domain of unknown function (DUF4192)